METRYNVFGTKDTQLIMKLEKDFLSFSDNYKVNYWTIPALIDGNILKKCGYFNTMPHQLTMAGHFSEKECVEIQSNTFSKIQYCATDGYFFTPAACIHLYPHIKDENIYNELITTYARVYRYENGHYEQGQRLWDFGVREFVAIGSQEYVKNFLNDFKKKALAYIKSLGIAAYLKKANDHFYPSRENDIKEKLQKANNLKTELIVNINNRELAIASFNYHKYHFSKLFEFDKNEKIVTGCVGFGIDRWVYLLNYLEDNKCVGK